MEVIVGTDEYTTTWNLPKALLSQHSEFFRAACNGPLKEKTGNRITLPVFYPNEFELLVHWLFFGTLPHDLGPSMGVYVGFRIWTLSERLILPVLKSAAMRHIYQFI
jgi:hypothetical protein